MNMNRLPKSLKNQAHRITGQLIVVRHTVIKDIRIQTIHQINGVAVITITIIINGAEAIIISRHMETINMEVMETPIELILIKFSFNDIDVKIS